MPFKVPRALASRVPRLHAAKAQWRPRSGNGALVPVEVADAIQRAREIIFSRRNLVVLTGAGVSTESGIPDYRSPGRPEYNPMTYSTFCSSASARRRYWARSYVAHERMHAQVQPNATHTLLADWERRGIMGSLITQNVDGLHSQAGSSNITELHGKLRTVHCSRCDTIQERTDFQEQLNHLNSELLRRDMPSSRHTPDLPGTLSKLDPKLNPDGDIEVDFDYEALVIPRCVSCDHDTVRPSFTFFGENLIPEVATRAATQIEECDGVLCLGSSLTVLSAFRLVREAAAKNKPVVAVTIGPTRADSLFDGKIHDYASRVLAQLDMDR